jgi:hypothetical protein
MRNVYNSQTVPN